MALSLQAAGSAKFESGGKKRKKVTINRRSGSVSGGMVATPVRNHGGRQWTAHSGSGSKKRKRVTNNRRCGSVSGGMMASSLQAAGSAK